MSSTPDNASGDKCDTAVDSAPLIDLHCHIIPAVDDGARDDEQALRMLRAAANDGIETIVATPHAGHTTSERIESGVERVNRLAREADIDIYVLPGCEVRIGADLVQRIQAGELLTIDGTRFVLLELYLAHSWAMDTVELVVDRLHEAGIWPVLAHVERYPAVQKDLSSIDGLLERGVPMQVNAPSLTGYHGPTAQRVAEQLAADGNLHVLASDAHNAERRAPRLTAAYERLAELVGEVAMHDIRRNAWKILCDEPLRTCSSNAIR